MAEEKLIRISLQLPVSELAGISALLDQMRQLLAMNREPPASQEKSERSDIFDEARFQELAQTAAAAESSADTTLPAATAEHDLNAKALQVSMNEIGDAETLRTEWDSEIFPTVLKADPMQEIDVRSLRAAVEEGAAAPSAAEFSLSDSIDSFLPERRRDAEQLVTAGPAPLTAEAVSMAFRRDDRRYDNGFPLY